jgi:Ca2+-transporting ATPase
MRRARPSPERGEAPAWHAWTLERALEDLQSEERGLSTREAAARLAQYGANELPRAEPPSIVALVVHQLTSPLIYLLVGAAVMAFLLGQHTDAAVIVAIVAVNAALGAVQEGRAERSLRALRRLSDLVVRVLREGREQKLEARCLVPGDVILVASGDEIGADARLLEAASLSVAEAALTGESVPVHKSVEPVAIDIELADRCSMLYAGTHVTGGRGRAVVVTTGVATEIGRIAVLTASAKEPKTPLERRIAQFGRDVMIGGIGAAALVVVIGWLRGLP